MRYSPVLQGYIPVPQGFIPVLQGYIHEKSGMEIVANLSLLRCSMHFARTNLGLHCGVGK